MTTILGQVKTLLGAVDALDEVYRSGWVPDRAPFPYAVILDPISNPPALSGDARTLARRRLLQIDLWQTAANEDDSLVDDVVTALDGVRVEAGRLKVQDTVMVPDDDPETVHHAVTLSVPTIQ